MFILMVRNRYFKNILRLVLVFVGCNYVSQNLYAQVYPADGDTINYRLVGFEVPEKKGVTDYKLEVWQVFITDAGSKIEEAFFKNESKTSIILTMLPAFCKNYQWRVKYLKKGIAVDSTQWYDFSVTCSRYTDTAKNRLRVINNKLDNQDFYIFIDATRTLNDKYGNPIWYLPDIPGILDDATGVRDLEMTPYNTITFITRTHACEIDYDGNLLWMAPTKGSVSGESTENYHHEFTRLKNGNYMVASSKIMLREVPPNVPLPTGNRNAVMQDGKLFRKIPFGTIIEYDSAGKVVWSWISGEHLTDEDMFTPIRKAIPYSTHMNAFYFDERNKVIYTSHRDINRIMKIAYPSGHVLANYGQAYPPTQKVYGDGLFYGQHTCRLSKTGELYLFNNNNNVQDSSAQKISSVVFLKEPIANNDSLIKTWEFHCDIDSLFNPFTSGGGGVLELTTGDILVCTGSGHNFIVSKSKKILWDAALELRTPEGKWEVSKSGYRNSAIESKEQLYNLIFSTGR